jgi:hypothetical protein
MSLMIVQAVQTAIACPSQWDLHDADGNYYYARYRYGCGEVRQYRTSDWVEAPENQLIRVVSSFEHGDSLDGYIELEEFARLAGLTLAPELIATSYGEHLRDELILDGVLPLEKPECD